MARGYLLFLALFPAYAALTDVITVTGNRQVIIESHKIYISYRSRGYGGGAARRSFNPINFRGYSGVGLLLYRHRTFSLAPIHPRPFVALRQNGPCK